MKACLLNRRAGALGREGSHHAIPKDSVPVDEEGRRRSVHVAGALHTVG
jgi:hypothetical protein